MVAKKRMYELYNSMTLSLNRGLTSRTQHSQSLYVATRTYHNEQRSKTYMTQLYINPALTLDQRGDQPRAVKRKRIRCKTNLQQTLLYIGNEQRSDSIYSAAVYRRCVEQRVQQ